MTPPDPEQKPITTGSVQGSVQGTTAPDGSLSLKIELTPVWSPPLSPDETKPEQKKPCNDPPLEECMARYRRPTACAITIAVLWMLACIYLPLLGSLPVWLVWLLSAAIFALAGCYLGLSITGRALGILINERKLMSISRVQVALWTLLILSAYFAIAAVRIRAGDIPDPLNIAIDWQIWAVMGISLGSFAGRTAIMGKKGAVIPENRDWEATRAAKNLPDETKDEIKENSLGVLYANRCIAKASFMDMFGADEVRNTRFVDIGKVQMFFFTVILLATYAAALFSLMATHSPAEITGFPPIEDGFVAVLGLSHAGLLASSGITYTPVKP
jgi:hypothetical protein